MRTAPEADNQDQWDVRIDHVASSRDQLFGRLSYFREDFSPVTPLPDGSGVTRGTLGPQLSMSWAFASHYLLNTPAFGAPATVLGAPNFGTITTAGDPRVVQLAVKMAF